MADPQAVHPDLARLWAVHQAAEWPASLGTHEGALMTLDTVVGGCVTYFVEDHHLDPPRVTILEDCLSDLETVLPELDQESLGYFERLKQLGTWVLELGRPR